MSHCRPRSGGVVRGFSLVEVSLSIAILSIILLSLFAMFTQGMFLLSHSKQVDQASERAHECLETVRNMGVASVVPGVFDSRAGDAPIGGFPPPPYNPAPDDYPMVVEATTTGSHLFLEFPTKLSEVGMIGIVFSPGHVFLSEHVHSRLNLHKRHFRVVQLHRTRHGGPNGSVLAIEFQKDRSGADQ